MDRRQAFREGFIEKLAELGVGPAELNDRLDSQAQTMFKSSVDLAGTVREGLSGVKDIGTGALMLALGLPFLGGSLAGYTLRPRTTETDITSMKELSLLREYQAAINQAEREQERERKRLQQ
jgi:hypothetical protein